VAYELCDKCTDHMENEEMVGKFFLPNHKQAIRMLAEVSTHLPTEAGKIVINIELEMARMTSISRQPISTMSRVGYCHSGIRGPDTRIICARGSKARLRFHTPYQESALLRSAAAQTAASNNY